MRKRRETLLGHLNDAEASPAPASVSPPVAGRRGLPGWVTIGSAVVGVLLIAYLLLGFLFAPWLVKKLVPETLEEQFPVTVSLERVRVNPITFAASLGNLVVRDEGGGDIISFERLKIRLNLFGLLRSGLHLEEIHLLQPVVHLQLDSAGRLNLLEVFASRSEATDSGDSSLPQLRVRRFAVEAGALQFRDERLEEAFTTLIAPVDFSLSDFSTLATRAGDDGAFALQAEGAGGFRLEVDGRLEADPFRIEGELNLENFELDHYNLYWRDFVSLEIAQGKLGARLTYRVTTSGDRPRIVISDGELRLETATLGAPGVEESILLLDGLDCDGINIDSLDRSLAIRQVRAQGVRAAAVIEDDGDWNFSVLIPEPGGVIPDPAAAADQPWSWEVGAMELLDFTLSGEDRPRGVNLPRLHLSEMKASLIGSNQDSATTWSWAGSLGENGAFSGSGETRLAPFRAALGLEGTQLPLAWLSPYTESSGNLRLLSGNLGLSGETTVTTGPEGLAWSVRNFSGKLEDVTTVSSTDESVKFDVEELSWDGFALDSTEKTVVGNLLLADRIDGSVARTGDAGLLLPWAGGVDSEDETTPAGAPPADSPQDWQVRIEKITVAQSQLSLIDRSMREEFVWRAILDEGIVERMGVSEGDGTTFAMGGSINNEATWKASGSGDLLNPRNLLDLEFALEPLQLTRVNPYAERFLGRRLSRGSLRLDLKYAIRDLTLEGSNAIAIDQLSLGSAVDSPDRLTNFPLGLAVAALQDSRGLIELDVGVTGRLDDPGFRIGGLVMRAIFNLLARAATSPFSLLANIVGTERELSTVLFAPGSAGLTPEAEEQLSILATALAERPQLALELYAENQLERDTDALKRQLLDTRLAQLQRQHGDAPEGDFHEDPEVYRHLLDLALKAEVGDGVGTRREPELEDPVVHASDEPVITETTPVLEVATVERKQPAGLFGRLFGIGGQSEETTVTEPVSSRAPAPLPPDSEPEPAVVSLEFPDEILSIPEAEQLLLEGIEVTAEMVQDLGRRRETAVRNFLIEVGQVAPERLFTVDGEPTGSDRDEPRVVFSVTAR